MKLHAALIFLWASPLAADMICTLDDETCAGTCPQTSIRFSIDPSQFVTPQDPNDPPRRQIAQVTLNSQEFQAQAIMMEGGITGFHSVQETDSTLMLVQADGSARLSFQPDGRILTGSCLEN